MQDPQKSLSDRIAATDLSRCTVGIDENAFVDWLVDARPGAVIAYYRGHLSHDRMPSTLVHPKAVLGDLSAVADRVMAAAGQGLVLPVQSRVGPCDWLYLAVRAVGAKPGPRTPSAAVATLRPLRVPEARSVALAAA